jgi:hypothetical protein
MREAKKTNPTLIEIINYWREQQKKNTGKLNMEHYMRVCEAKAYMVRFDDNNNMIRI